MADCRSVTRLLQRVVAGASVSEDQLREALEHVEGCAICSDRFELVRTAAFTGERTYRSDVSELPVDPAALFERALTAAMSDPETISRIRAAEQLGELERLGTAALEALAEAATSDSSDEVRAAALTALERLHANRLEGDFEKTKPAGMLDERMVPVPISTDKDVGEPVAEPAKETPVSDSIESLSKKTPEEPESADADK